MVPICLPFEGYVLILPLVWQLVRIQNKLCWNSKSMGMHLAHNIRV